MTTENKILDLSHEAAEDLSSNQFCFVVLNSSGQVRRPDSEAEIAYGILQNAPESGQAAQVRVIGVSKLVANAALAIGTLVKPEYVDAADAGKADDAGTQWKAARGIIVEAAGAEDDLAGCLLIGPFPQGAGALIGQTTVSTIATAGAVTYTAAQLLGGLILRDPAGLARSDVTPTAALIIAAIVQAGVGNSFEFTIKNDADAAETITVTAGVDVTLIGTMTIAQNNSKRFLCVVTAATTVTIYSLGTVVH
ncbi:MAG: hypothetical protein P1P89_13860 [Desulfobacterales bacterium]|nr:hypothetical protein [Desulfobacterales bacterium]